MKPHYVILAGVLLAACTPVDVPSPPPGAPGRQLELNTIPAEFRGTWTYKKDGRHPPGGEDPTVISATTWTGHETRGKVKAVRIKGKDDITVTMAMSGEGETWDDEYRLQLSPDGNVLTVATPPDQSGWSLYRVR